MGGVQLRMTEEDRTIAILSIEGKFWNRDMLFIDMKKNSHTVINK